MSNFRTEAAKVQFRNNDYKNVWIELKMYSKSSFDPHKRLQMI